MENEKWYTVAGIGINGCEMLLSKQEPITSEIISMMTMRARFNGHRNISLYSWLDDHKVTFEEMDDEIIRGYIIRKAKRLY